jgi:hypothetical protein
VVKKRKNILIDDVVADVADNAVIADTVIASAAKQPPADNAVIADTVIADAITAWRRRFVVGGREGCFLLRTSQFAMTFFGRTSLAMTALANCKKQTTSLLSDATERFFFSLILQTNNTINT